MPSTNLALIVLIYFLFVYLIAVRKCGQSLLVWFLLVAAQALSVYFFTRVYDYIKELTNYSVPICRLVTIGALLLANILLMVLLNLLFARNKDSVQDDYDAPLDDEEIPVLDAPVAVSQNEEIDNLQPVMNLTPNDAPQEDEDFFADIPPIINKDDNKGIEELPADMPVLLKDLDEQSESLNENEGELFDSIQDLIENGKTDEAVKYLRMVAFFGTNKQSIEQAKSMLQEL